MHVENDLVEFRTADDQEYEEIVKEYEEEIFVPEEFQEPPVTDTTNLAPAQGKPRCIIRIIFNNHDIYVCCAFTLQEFYNTHMHICYLPMSLTSTGSRSYFA
jgi:hypothetical protein